MCPVGVWFGVLTSLPRPGRRHYGRRRGQGGREQGGQRGKRRRGRGRGAETTAPEAEGLLHVSGTTDETSGKATTTKRPGTTTLTQTRRRKGAAAATVAERSSHVTGTTDVKFTTRGIVHNILRYIHTIIMLNRKIAQNSLKFSTSLSGSFLVVV